MARAAGSITSSPLTPTTALVIGKAGMISVLRAEHALSDRFVAHMLARNIRIEEDLLDQLFDSADKRLAGAPLLRARYGNKDEPDRVLEGESPQAPDPAHRQHG